MIKRLDHVGIIVNNMDEALKSYTNILGLPPLDKGIIRLPDKEGVQLVLLRIGDNFIELIQPTNFQNREGRFLRERGEGLFHLSIFTESFDAEVKALKEKGFAVEEEEIKTLFPGYTLRLAWLPPKDTQGVWIELVDSASVPNF
jgi:methylmalonyl-CoA/ethylmalonyl-CoA epimerase